MTKARSGALGRCDLSRVIGVLVVGLGVLLFCSSMFGQTANGRISGTVKDQGGGLIPGAAVTVTDTARGVARNLTTDEAGAYLAPNLLPSTYTVRATFAGFQTWLRENIRLEVGQDLAIDVVLLPGAQTQTVTIIEEVPLVNITSATLEAHLLIASFFGIALSYGTSITGACQKAAFCPVGSRTVTWQLYSPSGNFDKDKLNFSGNAFDLGSNPSTT